jgi:uncharacterized protein YnzC (UPF0291/DUF896 family)
MEQEKVRKSKPVKDSMITGPRSDGFYLGNDCHTIAEVWQVKEKLHQWIEQNPDRKAFWGPTEGSKQEKAEQSRLRHRYRLIWDAMEDQRLDAGSALEELCQIQQRMKAGITRVEQWATKAKSKDITILEAARDYLAGKQQYVPRQHCV